VFAAPHTSTLGVMKPARNLKRTQERNFSAHHMLIRAAELANKRAKKQARGWIHDELAAMTFSALAIEALCNSIGDRVFKDWDDFETSSPNAKLRLLADRLGLKYLKDKEPWCTARWLVKFRNLVAHAKPELIIEEKLITQEELDQRLFDRPRSKLEKWITAANADRAVRGAEAIKEALIRSMPPEDALGLAADAWTGSTRLDHDA
jgi:hypothetical protein